MRKLNFKLFVILGICLAMGASVFTACEPEDIDPTTPPTPPELLTVIDTTKSIPGIYFNFLTVPALLPNQTTDTIIIVNSNAELQALCSGAPEFDFTNASMLVCVGNITNGAVDITLENISGTTEYVLSLNALLAPSEYQGSRAWAKCFLTSQKLEVNTPISLQINMENYDQWGGEERWECVLYDNYYAPTDSITLTLDMYDDKFYTAYSHHTLDIEQLDIRDYNQLEPTLYHDSWRYFIEKETSSFSPTFDNYETTFLYLAIFNDGTITFRDEPQWEKVMFSDTEMALFLHGTMPLNIVSRYNFKLK